MLYFPSLEKFALIKLRSGAAETLVWPADKSVAWRKLDVSVLHVVILGHLLGIGEEQLTDQTNLEYVSDHVDAVKLADAKQHQCAVLMNATLIPAGEGSRRSRRHPSAKVHSLSSQADGRFGFCPALWRMRCFIGAAVQALEGARRGRHQGSVVRHGKL